MTQRLELDLPAGNQIWVAVEEYPSLMGGQYVPFPVPTPPMFPPMSDGRMVSILFDPNGYEISLARRVDWRTVPEAQWRGGYSPTNQILLGRADGICDWLLGEADLEATKGRIGAPTP